MSARLLGALVALVLAVGGCSSSDASEKEKAPKRLPAVTLDSLDEGGRPIELRSVRGPTVINLWASWCVPCKRELPIYQQFAEKYAGEVGVIGIDFQETRLAAARKLIKDTGVEYPLYADPDGEMRARFMPEVIMVDEAGEIVFEMYVEITSLGQLETLVRKHLGATTMNARRVPAAGVARAHPGRCRHHPGQ